MGERSDAVIPPTIATTEVSNGTTIMTCEPSINVHSHTYDLLLYVRTIMH